MEDHPIFDGESLSAGDPSWIITLLYYLFGSDGLFMGFSVAEVINFLGAIWTVLVFILYAAAAVMLFLYLYASSRLADMEEHEEEHMHKTEEAFARRQRGGATANRFADMKEHINSENPNDWKLAIIEADIILDESLKRQGYAGNSLGERLRSISPNALHSLDDAWQAHKLRNDIAHGGADFVLTHKLARETIVQYERVFTELGLLGDTATVTHH